VSVKGKNLRKALDDVGNRILLEARINIDKTKGLKSGQNDTGRMRKSLFFDIKEFNDRFLLRVGGNEYSEIIDEGRPPSRRRQSGYPLVTSIRRWIVRNRMRLQGRGLRGRRGDFTSIKNHEVKSLAYIISRKISNEGFRGSGFLTNAFKKVSDYADSRIIDAYSMDLEQEVDAMFADIKQLKRNFK